MEQNLAARLLQDHGDFADARPLVDVPGRSSPRVCQLLNELVRHMDRGECYLEIGTRQGQTLLSAAFGNFGRTCIGADDYRRRGLSGLGIVARWSLERNIARYRGRTADVHVHNASSRRLFGQRRISSPVGIYYWAGPGGYGAAYRAIVDAVPFLNERSVLLVDDWKDPVVRMAICAGLQRAYLRVRWFRNLRSSPAVERGWLGAGVFFLEKGREAQRLPRPLPSRASSARQQPPQRARRWRKRSSPTATTMMTPVRIS